MNKQERIQAIKNIIWEGGLSYEKSPQLQKVSTAIEEAIGVDHNELGKLFYEENRRQQIQMKEYPIMPKPIISKIIAKAISTNKEVIKIERKAE